MPKIKEKYVRWFDTKGTELVTTPLETIGDTWYRASWVPEKDIVIGKVEALDLHRRSFRTIMEYWGLTRSGVEIGCQLRVRY